MVVFLESLLDSQRFSVPRVELENGLQAGSTGILLIILELFLSALKKFKDLRDLRLPLGNQIEAALEVGVTKQQVAVVFRVRFRPQQGVADEPVGRLQPRRRVLP